MNKKLFVGLVGGLVLLLVGGGLMASNMGFKLNYVLDGQGNNGSATGTNTIALPFNQQTNLNNAFDLGQDIGGFGATVNSISRFNRDSDGLTIYTGSGPAFGLVPGDAYFVQLAVGVPSVNYIIVGSHDPGLTLQFDGVGSNGSNSGTNFYAYPYHSTASDANDLALELGGFTVVSAISQFNRTSDGLTIYTGSGPAFSLTPGKGYFVQLDPNTPNIQFVPSHY
jgi:hypothetical protein